MQDSTGSRKLISKVSVVAVSVIDVLVFRVRIPNNFAALVLNAIGNPILLSILGSRMLVNLKEAGEMGLNEGTNYRISSRTVSRIEFAVAGVEGELLEIVRLHTN